MDESALIKALLEPVSIENIDVVRSGAVLAIVDAFDRRVSRTLFLEIVSNSMPLYDWLGCLRMMKSVASLYGENKLSTDELDRAVAEYCIQADHSRDVLLRRMKGVVACAPSDATIH